MMISLQLHFHIKGSIHYSEKETNIKDYLMNFLVYLQKLFCLGINAKNKGTLKRNPHKRWRSPSIKSSNLSKANINYFLKKGKNGLFILDKLKEIKNLYETYGTDC